MMYDNVKFFNFLAQRCVVFVKYEIKVEKKNLASPPLKKKDKKEAKQLQIIS